MFCPPSSFVKIPSARPLRVLETQCVARTGNSAVDRPVKRGDGLFSYILDSPLCFFSYNVYFPPKDPFTSHIAQVQVQVKRGDGPYSWQSGDHSCPIKGYNMLFWFHKKLINSSDHCGNCRWVRMLITRFARFSTLGLEPCPEPPSGSQAPPPVPTAKTATQAAIHRSHFCNFAPPIIHSHIFVLTIPLRSQRSSWANVACLGI